MILDVQRNVNSRYLDALEQIVLVMREKRWRETVKSYVELWTQKGYPSSKLYEDALDAFCYFNEGQYHTFLKLILPIYNRALAENQTALAHYCEYRLGSAMFRLGRQSEASSYFTKALNAKNLGLNLLFSQANNYLGLMQFNLGNYDACISLIEESIKTIEDDPFTLIQTPLLGNLAGVWAEIGDHHRAQECLDNMKRMIEQFNLQGTHSEYFFICSYGGFLETAGRYQESIEWFERAQAYSYQAEDTFQRCEDILELCTAAKNGGLYSVVEQYADLGEALLSELNNQEFCEGYAELYLFLSEQDVYSQEKQYQFCRKSTELYRCARELSRKRESELISDIYDLQLKEAQLNYARSLDRNLSLINSIGGYLTTSSSLDAVAQRLHEDLSRFMTLDLFAIGLYDQQTQIIKFAHFFEDGELNQGYEVDCNNEGSMSAYVVKKQETYVENNFSQQVMLDVLGVDDVLIIGDGIDFSASAVFMPIMFEGEVLGVITVQAKTKFSYSEQQVKILEQVVNYLAMGLMNIKRHDELMAQKEKLRKLSVTDALTGLYNRQGLDEYIQTLEPKSDKEQSALFLIDVDHFKQYNDQYGHLAGDKLLQRLASVFNDALKNHAGGVFRFGGDEFMVILNDINAGRAEHVAKQISEQLQQCAIEHSVSPIAEHVTLSIGGVACETSEIKHIDTLVTKADKALYQAKDLGRNTTIFQS